MMTELSLNVLDVAQNSIKAEASLIEINVFADTKSDRLKILIKDNGRGMTEETVQKVTDPFYTTRTTRKVGLGVSFFKMAAELTGGTFGIKSQPDIGTEVEAVFVISSINRMPLGDMAGTIETLVVFNTGIDFIYSYKVDGEEFTLSTAEMKEILGGVPLNNPEVVAYIREYLRENTDSVNNGHIF